MRGNPLHPKAIHLFYDIKSFIISYEAPRVYMCSVGKGQQFEIYAVAQRAPRVYMCSVGKNQQFEIYAVAQRFGAGALG